MDVIATLIEVTAFDPVTNQNVVTRMTNRNDPRATTANNKSWDPVLSSSPSVGTSVFNGAFTGAGQIDLGDFTVTLADGLADPLTRLVWDGADVKIYAGVMDGVSALPLIYRAVGNGAQRRGRLELQVSLTTRASLLEVNILTQSYAGSGQLEGDLGLKGVLKPWVFGYARYCKPVLINAAKQIWQVSAYGPIESTTNVFEGGQEVTGFDGDKDLATMLGDAGPAQGKWWRNNEHGIFRLGSQPLYQITAHVRGDTNAVVGGTALVKIGDIIGRIMALTTTATVKASSLAALNAAITKPFDDYFDSQQTVSQAMTDLLLSVGGYYTFNEGGDVIFGLVRFGNAVLNLDGLNRVEPTVMGINQVPTSAPVWYLRVGAEQCHYVHDASNLPGVIAQQGIDVAKAQATADAKNKTFPPSSQPPVGAVDGDQWPDTSVSPTTMRRYNSATGTWIATSNQITTANQVPYANGQTIEALRPAQAGSDVTGQNTASAITNQGSLATLNSLANGSSYLTGFGNLSSLASLAFGSPYLLEQSGGASATLNAFKTILGIASSVTGQGSLATLSSLANGSQYLTGFGSLSSLASLAFGGPYLLEQTGGAAATLSNFKTILGTAASITGQGFGATAAQNLIDNRQVPVGVNKIVNSNFARGTYGFMTQANQFDIDYPGYGGTGSQRHVLFARYTGTLAPGSEIEAIMTRSKWVNAGTLEDNRKFGLPVKPGQRVFFGGLTSLHRATGTIFALCWTQSGDMVFAPSINCPYNGGGENGNPATMFKAESYFDVPTKEATGATSDIAYVTLLFRMIGVGQTDCFFFLMEPKLGLMQAGQTVIPDYIDGPADPVADQTSVNTASAIAGQGSLATLSSLANGSSYLTGFGALSSLASVMFGSSYLLESAGTPATLSNFKTSQGTAAAIAGQGALATTSTISGDSQLSGFMLSRLAGFAQDPNYLRADRMAWLEGATVQSYKPQEGGANVTENRVASAITNQGSLATQGAVRYSDQIDQLPQSLLYTNMWKSGTSYYLAATSVVWAQNATDGATVESLRPGERGSNVTETRTASAITNQGSLATKSSADYGTQITGLPAMLTDTVTRPGYNMPSIRSDYITNTQYSVALAQRWPQEAGSNVTETRTASAITGQTVFATLASGTSLDNAAFGMPTRMAPWSSDSRYLNAGSVAFAAGNTIEGLKPGEAGANVTESRTAAAITNQGFGATASRAAVDNTYNALGVNTQIDSGFARGAATWRAGGQSTTNLQFAFNRPDYSGKRSVAYMYATGVQAAGTLADMVGPGPWTRGDKLNNMLKYSMPAKAGDTIGIRALVGAHRCTATLFLLLLKNDGELKIAPSTSTGYVPGGGAYGDNFGTMQFTYKITDTDVVAAQFMIRMNGTGESDPYVFFSEPWLGKLADGQTVIPPYTPGPADPTSDQTSVNQAASIAGQGALATKGSVAYGTGDVTGFGSLAGRSKINLGVPADGTAYLANQTDSYVVTDALAITSQGTAAAFSGQGALATASTIDNDGQLSGQVKNRLAPSNADPNYLAASRVAWDNTGNTVQNFKPQEAGSNITENRTSAAITNQGFGATAAQNLIDNRSVPVGANKLVNSNFARGTFGFQAQGGNQFGIDYPGYGGASGQRHVIYSRYNGTLSGSQSTEAITTRSPWNGGVLEDLRQFGLAVKPGQRVFFGALTGCHRCTGTLFALCYTADGNMVFAPAIGLQNNGGGLYGDPANFQKAESYFDVPTKAATGASTDIAYVALLFRMQGVGQNDSFIFMTEPKLGIMGPGQTVIPDYTDGPPDPQGDKTGTNTAAAIAGQGAFATAPTIAGSNVGQYFNFSAFQLGYSITRSDGATTVTESLVVTSVGIASGFAGQGGLATKNNVTFNDIVSTGTITSYNGQGGRVERDGNGERVYYNNGQLAVKIGF